MFLLLSTGNERTIQIKLLRLVVIQFITSLVVISLLLEFKVYIDTTSIGSQLEQMGQNFLLSKLHDNADNVITIVDIGDLPKVGGITSREALEQLITAISDKSPAVIGLDVDFGPAGDHYMDTENDPSFFKFCRFFTHQGENSNRADVPIILGIFRSREIPPTWWLGPNAANSDMSANIGVDSQDTRTVPIWSSTSVAGHWYMRGRSFSYAVAHEFLIGSESEVDKARAAKLNRLFWSGATSRFVSQVSLNSVPCRVNLATSANQPCKYQTANVLVDYSDLGQFEDLYRVVRWNELVKSSVKSGRTITQINDLSASRFSNLFTRKIVLVGNASEVPSDIFAVPNARFHLGIFTHACAIDTLIHSPLWEFTALGKLAVDISISLIILAAVTSLRVRAILQKTQDLNRHRLHIIFTGLVFVAIFSQFALVNCLHLIWDDFLVVSLALILHSLAEELWTRCIDWLKNRGWPAMVKYVSEEIGDHKQV